MQGSVQGGLTQKHDMAVEHYDKALAILKWGNEEWKDVPKEDRGAIFEHSFIRGVRGLRLESYMQVSLTCLHKFYKPLFWPNRGIRMSNTSYRHGKMTRGPESSL